VNPSAHSKWQKYALDGIAIYNAAVRRASFAVKTTGKELNMKAPSIWKEFKAFAFKGNMIDLAVAVVIGAAFGTVIKSIVDNIIMPLVAYVTPNMTYTQWHIGRVLIGKFLGDLLNFLIIAFAVFITIVKLLGAMMKRVGGEDQPAEPATKECPFCLSNIPYRAKKCAHCTADLPAVDAPVTATV